MILAPRSKRLLRKITREPLAMPAILAVPMPTNVAPPSGWKAKPKQRSRMTR
jgi:hypothetical protein